MRLSLSRGSSMMSIHSDKSSKIEGNCIEIGSVKIWTPFGLVSLYSFYAYLTLYLS